MAIIHQSLQTHLLIVAFLPFPTPLDMATNFDSLGSWTQLKNDKFDWTVKSGGTPSSNTGPSSGHGNSGK